MQKVMISRTGTILLKKSRQCLVTRAIQQMPNGRLKPSNKRRNTLQIS